MWDSIFNWITRLLTLVAAYFAGRSSVKNEIELKNLEKQKEYAEIEAEDRTDEDTKDRLNDGTF